MTIDNNLESIIRIAAQKPSNDPADEEIRLACIRKLQCFLAPMTHSIFQPDNSREDVIIGYWAEDNSKYVIKLPRQLRDRLLAILEFTRQNIKSINPSEKIKPVDKTTADTLQEALDHMKCYEQSIPCKAVNECFCFACKSYNQGQKILEKTRKAGIKWE